MRVYSVIVAPCVCPCMCVFVFIYIHIHTRLSLSLSLSFLSLCRSLVYMCSNVVYFPLEVWKWTDRLASVATRRSLRARRDILDDGSKCNVVRRLVIQVLQT
jgi:hypothetical protein